MFHEFIWLDNSELWHIFLFWTWKTNLTTDICNMSDIPQTLVRGFYGLKCILIKIWLLTHIQALGGRREKLLPNILSSLAGLKWWHQGKLSDNCSTLWLTKTNSDSGSVNYPHWGGCVSGVRVGRPLIERLVLGQDPKPIIAPEGCTISECMCVND